MDGVVPIPPSVDVAGPVTQEKLTKLTTQLLGAHFQGDLNALLQSYADFCYTRGTKANRHSHLEWACELLNIKIEKHITL